MKYFVAAHKATMTMTPSRIILTPDRILSHTGTLNRGAYARLSKPPPIGYNAPTRSSERLSIRRIPYPNSDMITMTPSAMSEIKRIKEVQNLGDDTFLRIGIMGGGCSGMQYSLNFDTTFDGMIDTQYDFDGVVLTTAKKFDPHFDGTEINFVDGLMGSGFAIDNPNFPKGAGCAGCGH